MRWAYQTSSMGIVENRRTVSRYVRIVPVTTLSSFLLGKAVVAPSDLETGRQSLHIPLPRSGSCLIKVIQVEDKVTLSLRVPKIPKLDMWASPQSWTRNPESGVTPRSAAMGRAAPREYVKGETSIRPCRMGTNFGGLGSPLAAPRVRRGEASPPAAPSQHGSPGESSPVRLPERGPLFGRKRVRVLPYAFPGWVPRAVRSRERLVRRDLGVRSIS